MEPTIQEAPSPGSPPAGGPPESAPSQGTQGLEGGTEQEPRTEAQQGDGLGLPPGTIDDHLQQMGSEACTPIEAARAERKDTEQSGTWGDKVRANITARQTMLVTEDMARKSHMLEGVWNPAHIHQLVSTLRTDWDMDPDTNMTAEELEMRTEALAPAKASCDDSVRAWAPRENAILVAYLNGSLELPHPPNFVKEILVSEHRAMLEDMHETYYNATLTAVIPASVRLHKHAAHAVIYRELFLANTDKNTGHAMMRALQRDVKRLSFDGVQTITFVFFSRSIAARWTRKTLRYQKAVISLQDTERNQGNVGSGTYTVAQLEIQYAVRVYGGEHVGLVALARAFAQFSGATVLDVEYARATKVDIYDNRYYTIKFAQQQCPDKLRGVTRMMFGSMALTIHHYQRFLRIPCTRCLDQRHGTAKCTQAPKRVPGLRAKASRIVEGDLVQSRTVALTNFRVDYVDKLLEMLNTNAPKPVVDSPATLTTITDHTGDEGDTVVAQLLRHPRQGTGPTPLHNNGPSATQTPDADGFYTHTARRKQPAPPNSTGQPEPGQPLPKAARTLGVDPNTGQQDSSNGTGDAGRGSRAAETKSGNGNASKKGNRQSKGKQQKQQSGLAKSNKRFQQFQRIEALGQYGALADSEDEEDHDADMDVDEATDANAYVATDDEDDEAPYAYMSDDVSEQSAAPETVINAEEDIMMELTESETIEPTRTPLVLVGVVSDNTAAPSADPRKPAKTKPKARGAKRTKGGTTGVGLPEGVLKGMRTSMASYMHQSRSDLQQLGEATQSDEVFSKESEDSMDAIVPCTPDSQEDFTMGITRTGSAEGDDDLPIQVNQWLDSFGGHMVRVSENGQCGFLALHASLQNVDSKVMKNTKATVEDATEFKWFVYSLMMKKLRRDVELGLVDPIYECSKLYPDRTTYPTVEGTTAALYAHYDSARNRSVATTVPATFWAGTHELRAAAQYLREPLLVLDTDSIAGDAHIQRYGDATHRLTSGADHETGHVHALSDRVATEYLRACWSLKVMPTFLILDHKKRHFYGDAHDHLFYKWRAEGDEEFASSIPDGYEWKMGINEMSTHERTVDLGTISTLTDRADVNAIVCKRLHMRARLDLVHARMGLPILDSIGIEADWDVVLAAEERHIHMGYGVDGYASSQPDVGDTVELLEPTRYPRAATGPVVMSSYFRLLRDAPDSPMDEVDKPLARLVATANSEAFGKWCNLYRQTFAIPQTKRRNARIEDISEWLLTRSDALRHLFLFLPYPEYEAKRWPTKDLLTWGAEEVYREQVGALTRLADDEKLGATIRKFCTEWLRVCTDTELHPLSTQTLARSVERWTRLQKRVPEAYCRAQPTGMTEAEWYTLHIMPYTVGDWNHTVLGRVPNGARAAWYTTFPFVRALCHGVVERGDWSAATLGPTGQAWGMNTMDIDDRVSPPRRN